MKLILPLLLISICSFGQTLIDPSASPTTARINNAISEALVASGTDAYTVSVAGTYNYTYLFNRAVSVTFTNPNTGASTLDFDGLGAKNIYKWSGGSLGAVSAGDLIGTIRVRYDGTQFVKEESGSSGYLTLSGTQALTGNKIISGSGTNYNFSIGDTGAEVGAFTVLTTGTSSISSSASNTSSLSVGGNIGSLRNGAIGYEATPTGLNIIVGSDATGDTYQKDAGGYFSRLASVSAGSFLRTGGVATVNSWSTVKLPDTMSALGLWVANSANTTVNLTATANQSIRVNAGGTAWEAYTPSAGGGLTVGTSTITSGTNTRILYNNSGVLGEYTISGSGNVAMTTSPVFTTPSLGAATATGLVITSGVTTGTGATAGIQGVFNSLTTGNGLDLSSSSYTTGAIQKITSTSTAINNTLGTNGVFQIAVSGAMSSSRTAAGLSSIVTTTGTTSKNVAGYFSASGATNNNAIEVGAGNIKLATANIFDIGGATFQSTTARSTTINSPLAATAGTYVFRMSSVNEAETTSTVDLLQLFDGFNPTSGSNEHRSLVINPILNQTGTATGNHISILVKPTVTSMLGSNYALYATSGDIFTAGNILSTGSLTTAFNVVQTRTNTKRETVSTNLGVLTSSSTSTSTINVAAYYSNNTTLLARVMVVAVKTDGSASAHSIVTCRFRKDSSGTFTADDTGIDTPSDITVLADVVGEIGGGGAPQIKVTMGAASGDWQVSWTVDVIEVKN